MKKNYFLLFILISANCFAQTKSMHGFQQTSIMKNNEVIVNNKNTPKVQLKPGILNKADVAKMPFLDLKSFDFTKRHLKAPSADLQVAYGRPDGTFYEGMDTDFKGWNIVQVKAPAEVTIPFYPGASEAGVTFSWVMSSNNASLAEFVDTRGVLNWDNKILRAQYAYYMPKLEGTKSSQKASYMLGQNVNSNARLYAGDAQIAPLSLVDINANKPEKGNLFIGFQNGDNFGPSYSYQGVPCDGLVTVIQKLLSPLYAESVDVFVYAPEGVDKMMPANGELILDFYYLDGTKEAIATATATKNDFTDDGHGGGYFHFTFQEEEDGFVTELPLILGTKEAIAAFIHGFDTNWKIQFFMGFNNWEGSAYTVHQGQLSTFGYEDQTYGMIPEYDLYMNFNGFFNCLSVIPETSKIEFPAEGGYGFYTSSEDGKNYNDIAILSSFDSAEDSEDIWIEDMPSWITGISVDNQYWSEHNLILFFISANPLDTGETGRSGKIVFGSYGITTTVYVKQGDADWISGISPVATEITQAVRQGNNFQLTYPKAAQSVAVYNIAGQKIAEKALNASGRDFLPAAHLANGVYILKFNGTNTTVKVIK